MEKLIVCLERFRIEKLNISNQKRKCESPADSLLEANSSANIPSENFEPNMNHNDQNHDSRNVVKASGKNQEDFEAANEIQPDSVGSEGAKKKSV